MEHGEIEQSGELIEKPVGFWRRREMMKRLNNIKKEWNKSGRNEKVNEIVSGSENNRMIAGRMADLWMGGKLQAGQAVIWGMNNPAGFEELSKSLASKIEKASMLDSWQIVVGEWNKFKSEDSSNAVFEPEVALVVDNLTTIITTVLDNTGYEKLWQNSRYGSLFVRGMVKMWMAMGGISEGESEREGLLTSPDK